MKEKSKVERIKVINMIHEPDPKEFGFKSQKDFELKRSYNYDEDIKAIKKKRITYFLIILLQLTLLMSIFYNNNQNFMFILFIVLDFAILPLFGQHIDSKIQYKKEKEIKNFEKEIGKYNDIIFDLKMIDRFYYDKFISTDFKKPDNEIFFSDLYSLNINVCEDVFTVYQFSINGYERQFVIRLIDELLIYNVLHVFDFEEERKNYNLTIALNWLVSVGVISKSDLEARKPYEKIKREQLAKENNIMFKLPSIREIKKAAKKMQTENEMIESSGYILISFEETLKKINLESYIKYLRSEKQCSKQIIAWLKQLEKSNSAPPILFSEPFGLELSIQVFQIMWYYDLGGYHSDIIKLIEEVLIPNMLYGKEISLNTKYWNIGMALGFLQGYKVISEAEANNLNKALIMKEKYVIYEEDIINYLVDKKKYTQQNAKVFCKKNRIKIEFSFLKNEPISTAIKNLFLQNSIETR